MSERVQVAVIPQCDFCGDGTPAVADARVPAVGSWANVCEFHFTFYGCKVGTGRGQYLTTEPVERQYDKTTLEVADALGIDPAELDF